MGERPLLLQHPRLVPPGPLRASRRVLRAAECAQGLPGQWVPLEESVTRGLGPSLRLHASSRTLGKAGRWPGPQHPKDHPGAADTKHRIRRFGHLPAVGEGKGPTKGKPKPSSTKRRRSGARSQGAGGPGQTGAPGTSTEKRAESRSREARATSEDPRLGRIHTHDARKPPARGSPRTPRAASGNT